MRNILCICLLCNNDSKRFLGFWFLFSSCCLFSQTGSYAVVSNTGAKVDSVIYSRDYEFKEGVYLSLKQLKGNCPVSKLAIVSTYPKSEPDFFTEVLRQKEVVFLDSAGAEHRFLSSGILGYCSNRTIYLNIIINDRKTYHRLDVVGSLSLFTAFARTDLLYNNPNNNNSLHQFIYDMRTNKMLDFSAENMEKILESDSVLYDQFMALKKRAKANSIFIYLRKYNERHPLYLPLN